MPKFTVFITRDTTESAIMEVVAANALEARGIAYERSNEWPQLEWAPDDGGSGGDPYVSDVLEEE